VTKASGSPPGRPLATLSRRSLLAGAGGALVSAPALVRSASLGSAPNIVVVGAGVFGSWTAEQLHRRGARVTLLDQSGPANSRASSGGESRMTRAGYGKDAIYSRMARDSLAEWKALSAASGLPIFHPHGVLFFTATPDDYFRDSLRVTRELGLPIEELDRAALARRFPMIDFSGVELGMYEPGFGALMARRAVQTLVQRFVGHGGTYRQARLDAASLSSRAIQTSGCPRSFPTCWAERSWPRGRKCSSSPRPRAATCFRPRECPAGPISTAATSITAFRTWNRAA
jgi:hypothetical protein